MDFNQLIIQSPVNYISHQLASFIVSDLFTDNCTCVYVFVSVLFHFQDSCFPGA
jgi:hypothetical protein